MASETPTTTRDRRRLRTRRELGAAAARLFEEKGFADTTVEEIAEAADYSASTFFRMFVRKEDAVFFDMPDRLDALRAEVGDPDAVTLWPVLRAALIAHAQTWEEDDAELAAARVRLFHLEPALAARYLEYCLEYEVWIAGLIGGAGADTDTAAQLAAASIVAALRVAFRVQTGTAGGDGSVAAYLEEAFATLEAGPLTAIGPPQPA